MNLVDANTEPFYRFVRFHEGFNRNIRVMTGALELLRARTATSSGKIKSTLLPTGNEPWGEVTKWNDVPPLLDSSTHFVAQMGWIRVYSAFEDFLGGIRAERDRYFLFSNREIPSDDRTSENLLISFCRSMSFHERPLSYLVPLFEYINCMRNCIVHRSSRATSALVEISESAAFKRCCGQWPNARGKRLPALPKLRAGDEISLKPRHAILASEVCFNAASYMNQCLIGMLGENGFLNMAAHHSLLTVEPSDFGDARSAETTVNKNLFGRYRVKDHDATQTAARLRALGLWEKCYAAHKVLLRSRVGSKWGRAAEIDVIGAHA